MAGKRAAKEGKGQGPGQGARGIAPTPGSTPEAGPSLLRVLREIQGMAAELEDRAWAWLAALGRHPVQVYGGDVREAYRRLRLGVGRSQDVVLRRFWAGGPQGRPALLAFVQGLVDELLLDRGALALAQRIDPAELQGPHPARALAQRLAVGHVTRKRRWSELLQALLEGSSLLFVDGDPEVLVLDTVKYPARSVPEPATERSVLGSQEAFNEVLLTHMNQLRRYVHTPRLVMESHTLGREAPTRVVLAYVDGITNPALVEAVRRRLASLPARWILGPTSLVSALKDHPWTPFPLARLTERVDLVAYEVLQGRVALLMESSPFQIVVPVGFVDFFRSIDDYEGPFWGGTMSRLVRLFGFLVGVYAPALYIALVEVNPDLLPTRLLWTIAGSRINVPFPPVVEVFIMFATIELLREASIRLPKTMSQTLGTVGAIVIGTAVVKAGIVSDLMIVVVTITAVGVFTMPAWELTVTLRWLMWPMVLGSYLFGLYGLLLVTVLMVSHMASLSSLGVPYLAPFGPFHGADLGDTFVRPPQRDLRLRPHFLFPLRARRRPAQGPLTAEPDVPLRAEKREEER